MKRRFKIKVRDPITVDLLDKFCSAIGVDPDLALKDPAGALEDLSLTPAGAKRVIQVACKTVPRKMGSWPVSEVVALGELVVTDFFIRAFMAQSAARMGALTRHGTGSDYRPARGLA